MRPSLRQRSSTVQAVDLRQAEVEDHGVVIFGRAEIMAVLAVGGEVDRIARAFQRRAELAPEIGFVFDDQNAHRCSPELFIFAPSTRVAARGCFPEQLGSGGEKSIRDRNELRAASGG